MLEFLTDQNFLAALGSVIGPLAFFAAPTEEIEHLLMASDASEFDAFETAPALDNLGSGLLETAFY